MMFKYSCLADTSDVVLQTSLGLEAPRGQKIVSVLVWTKSLDNFQDFDGLRL